MVDLFKDIVPAILLTKKDVFSETDPEYNDYNPYMVNRAISFHVDCILYANEMNINYTLDRKMQNDYLLKSVRQKKRPFQQWVKFEKSEEIAAIKEYYDYSYAKAKEALKVLSREQVDFIIKSLDKGGKK